MAHKTALDWDGEMILQKTQIQDEKVSPKDLIDTLAHARSQVTQMEEQKEKALGNVKMMESEIRSATKFIEERAVFEEKCHELQKKKLTHFIALIKEDCKKEADKQSKEIIARDPNTYTEELAKNVHYVNYQMKLARHPKVAERISKHVITQLLYDTPIFENPYL